MKKTITYNNTQYVEQNINYVEMATFTCECGNKLNIPLALQVLGITEDCGHCNRDFTANHEKAVTSSYIELISDSEEQVVEL